MNNTIDINGVDYDLDTMDIDEIKALKMDVLETLMRIKTQIDEAKRIVGADGLYSEPDWYRRVTYAKRVHGVFIQKIDQVLSAKKKDAHINLRDAFVDVAKEVLTDDGFMDIMDEARDRVGLVNTIPKWKR